MNEVTTVQGGGVALSPAPSIVEVLLSAARDPQMDAAKLKALYDIKRDMEAEAAHEAFNDAFAQVEGEIQAVVKDADNPQTRSKYARLDAIQTMMQPILHKHGVAISFDITNPDPTRVSVAMIVSRGKHERRYGPTTAAPDTTGAKGSVNKTELHGLVSATTYLQRMLLSKVFNIPLASDDDDGNAGGGRLAGNRTDSPRDRASRGEATEDQLQQVRELLAETRTEQDKFLEYYKVRRVDDLDGARATHAIRTLTAKRDKAAVAAVKSPGRIGAWLDEIEQLWRNAPPGERQVMLTSADIVQARATLTGPALDRLNAIIADARADAKPSPVQGFSAMVLDAYGEPADGEFHTDPLRWAEAFATLHDDTFPADRANLLHHNSDAMRAAGEAAALAGETSRYAQLLAGVEPTVGQNVGPANGAAEQKADAYDAKPGKPAAKPKHQTDEDWAERVIIDLSAITERGHFDALIKRSRERMARLQAEKPALFARVNAFFQGKHEDLPQ